MPRQKLAALAAAENQRIEMFNLRHDILQFTCELMWPMWQ
jgi:hypothetical protein